MNENDKSSFSDMQYDFRRELEKSCREIMGIAEGHNRKSAAPPSRLGLLLPNPTCGEAQCKKSQGVRGAGPLQLAHGTPTLNGEEPKSCQATILKTTCQPLVQEYKGSNAVPSGLGSSAGSREAVGPKHPRKPTMISATGNRPLRLLLGFNARAYIQLGPLAFSPSTGGRSRVDGCQNGSCPSS